MGYCLTLIVNYFVGNLIQSERDYNQLLQEAMSQLDTQLDSMMSVHALASNLVQELFAKGREQMAVELIPIYNALKKR